MVAPRAAAIAAQLEEIASDVKLQKDLEIVRFDCHLFRVFFSSQQTIPSRFRRLFGKFALRIVNMVRVCL
jgi:hypothetical protein